VRARHRGPAAFAGTSELLTGAQILCRVLLEEGVDVLFGYPGGAIMPFYDALPDYPRLRHVLVRHEQAAAHAADGYARASGRLGVCVATSGPGATNLVTGLATAQMDSSPVLAITGQVATEMMGRDAFQETDVIGVALAVTKHCAVVRDVKDLAGAAREAIYAARDGRPGPVLLDVPKDMQNARAEFRPAARRARWQPAVPAPEGIQTAAGLIAAAERPVILAGHGVLLARASAELRAFAERTDIPVITTLLGISAFPTSHRLHLGMPGMHGEVHVNCAIQHADLIIGIGLRFDDRVTGNTAKFAPHARIIHVDLDPTEIGRTINVTLPLMGDARATLRELLATTPPGDRSEWRATIAGSEREVGEDTPNGVTPTAILDAIRVAGGESACVVSDVGQHQMWVAKRCRYTRPNTHFTSGGLGTMGFAVPAAMGVKLARPHHQVWAISGDGGFQMNMQEMATMVQEGIAVKLAVFNNGYLGMVRQWQQFFHRRRYSATPIWSPDYVRLAEAYGIPGQRVIRGHEIEEAVGAAAASPGPALVEFVIEQEANVFPMIPPGASLSEGIEGVPATVQ
jgi:acetolactate synthase-1/2/3 large subunit